MMHVDLRVGRQTNAGNLSNLAEELADGVLVNLERKVTDEKGIALGAEGVAMALGAVGSTVLGVGLSRLGVGVVKVQGATVNLLALHGLVSLGGRLGVGEVDVTKATAAASVLVSDDASADEVTERLEGLVQGVVIDTPAEGTGEEGGGSVDISLGLLGGLVDLLLSLALLGGSLGLGLFLFLIVRVIAVVRVLIRVL